MRRTWGGGASGLGVKDALMKDARLSIPARGLAVHLLLLSESARPDRARLAARPGETEGTIEGYLAELEDVGYLTRRVIGGAEGVPDIEELTLYARPPAPEDAAETAPGRVFRWPALERLPGESEGGVAPPAGDDSAGAAVEAARDGEPDDEPDDDPGADVRVAEVADDGPVDGQGDDPADDPVDEEFDPGALMAANAASDT